MGMIVLNYTSSPISLLTRYVSFKYAHQLKSSQAWCSAGKMKKKKKQKSERKQLIVMEVNSFLSMFNTTLLIFDVLALISFSISFPLFFGGVWRSSGDWKLCPNKHIAFDCNPPKLRGCLCSLAFVPGIDLYTSCGVDQWH